MRVVEGYANSKHNLYFCLNSLIKNVFVKGDKKRPRFEFRQYSGTQPRGQNLKENPVNAANPLKLTTSTF